MKLYIVALFIPVLLIACGAQNPLERGEDFAISPTDDQKDNNGVVQELSERAYNSDVLPVIQDKCSTCHRPGMSGPVGEYSEDKKLAVFGDPENSPLYSKPTGSGHPRILAPDSPEAQRIATWILGSSL